MNKNYIEQDKPIYKWTLLSNGKIKKSEPITEYFTRSSMNCTRIHMKYPGTNTVNSIRAEKFDCFKNSTVYSYDGDDDRARKIIRDALEAKVHMLKKDYDKALEDLARFDVQN